MTSPRDLPPVDALAAQVDAPRAVAVAAARAVLAERRRELLAGSADEVDLAERARAWAADASRPRLRRVLNATGVIVHTNLGRAPLAAAARAAVARAALGYSNLEFDLETGARGSRHDHVEALLRELTGAILRAHPSNFRQLGFVQEVEIEELCELGVPVIDDVVSGLLADELELLQEEPPVRRSVRAGAALVCFS